MNKRFALLPRTLVEPDHTNKKGKFGDELVPTDGRSTYESDSKYSIGARKQQYIEAIYLFLMLCTSLLLMFLTWRGIIAHYMGLSNVETLAFNKYAYYAFSGLLGGTVIGMKFHYHVVAKGLWHEDRSLWRFLSPWLSLGVAFGIGALVDAGVVTLRGGATSVANAAAYVGIGFLIGLFSDAAIRMLQRIADAVFGPSKDDGKNTT